MIRNLLMMKGKKMKINNLYYTSRIMLRAIIFMLILCVPFLFTDNPKPYIFGLLVGGNINVLLFKLHYLNLLSLVERNSKSANVGAVFNYFIRYLITGIVLAVSAKADYMNFWTTALGFLMIRFSIYYEYIGMYLKNRFGGKR